MNIEGKRILFIGPGFYDYEKAIVEVMQKQGANVAHICSVYQGFLKRVCKRLKLGKSLHLLQKEYLKKELNDVHGYFDCVFIIKGEGFDEEHIDYLKKNISNKIVLYLWDAFELHENSELLYEQFPTILSFDRCDCLKYGFTFRPLFYRITPQFDVGNNLYDISFVGWMHSDRYLLLSKLKDIFQKQGIKYKFIIHTGRFKYLIDRYIKHSIRKGDENFFVFRQIPYSDYIDISCNSRVILDISHPKQRGLTIRAIETVGLNKALLTTNSDIKHYSNISMTFYSIIDRDDPIIDWSFFYKNDNASANNDYEYYSLDRFVRDIFNSI